MILFVLITDYVLSLYGYKRLNYGDLSLWYEKPGLYHNLAGYFVMDKIDFAHFSDYMYERAITKLPKLRSRVVNKFGVYLWEDLG